jgi:hypothetical protein
MKICRNQQYFFVLFLTFIGRKVILNRKMIYICLRIKNKKHSYEPVSHKS